MDVRRLVVLRAIAEHRSFTRAARQLVTTQPAVSRQLAALEGEVGAQLVVRGPRHVSLTPAGAALLQDAEAILPAIESAARRVRAFSAADAGAVRIGAVPSALATFVPRALRALRARRPRVEVQVDEGWSADLARLAARGDLDLAVVSATGAVRADGRLLVREPFLALLPADGRLARRRRLALRDLAGEGWLVAPGPGGRDAVLAACAAAGFSPRITGSASWDAAGPLVGAGIGVALAPEGAAAAVARERGVVARPLADGPVRELRLIRPPGRRRTPVERDLEEDLLQAARGEDPSPDPATPSGS